MRRRRWALVLLTAIVAAGALARTLFLLLPNGAEATAHNDEGTYIAAALLLQDGLLPYRDTVLVHPPGAPILLTPVLWAAGPFTGPEGSFLVARWTGALAGVAVLVLVAALAWRWRGALAGVVAAGVAAAYVPAVDAGSHLLLEPIATALSLGAALIWLHPRHRGRTGAAAAGLLAGLAVLVKVTGGAVLVALMLTEPLRGPWSRRLTAVAAWAATVAVGLAPYLVLAGPGTVFDQVVRLQLERPGGGGIQGPAERAAWMLRVGVLSPDAVPDAVRLLAFALVAAAAVWAWRRGGAHGRFASSYLGVTVAGLLVAPDYYLYYAVPVGAAAALVIGWATAELVARLGAGREHRTVALQVGAIGLVALSTLAVLGRQWRDRPVGAEDLRAVTDPLVGTEDCLTGIRVDLVFAADRLPVVDGSGGPLIDPYGELLLRSLDGGYDSNEEALTSREAQARILDAVDACRFLAVRESSRTLLSASTERYIDRKFVVVTVVSGGTDDGSRDVTLYERRRVGSPP
jgi:hypothetical protein